MPDIIKTNRANFAANFDQFIANRDKKTLLVRCYEHTDSIREVFSSLINNSDTNNGIVKVRAMQSNPRIFKGIMPEKELKRLHQGDIVGSNDFRVIFESKSYFENVRNRFDFEIFCPIETILFEENNTNKLKKTLKTATTKTILITTNDYDKNAEKLFDVIDEVIILDTTKEPKNIDAFSTLRQNIINRDGKLPY